MDSLLMGRHLNQWVYAGASVKQLAGVGAELDIRLIHVGKHSVEPQPVTLYWRDSMQ